MLKERKIIPWIGLSKNLAKVLVHQTPVFIKTWEVAKHWEIFPRDRRIVLLLQNNIILKPNYIICTGNATNYHKYCISGPIHQIQEGLYILDVEYLGVSSDNKHVKITYTIN